MIRIILLVVALLFVGVGGYFSHQNFNAMKAVRGDILGLESDITRTDNQIAETITQREGFQDDVLVAQREKGTREGQRDSVQAAIAALDREIPTLTAQLETLTAELQLLQQTKQELIALFEEMGVEGTEEVQDMITELTNEIAETEQALEETMNNITVAETNIERLEGQLGEVNRRQTERSTAIVHNTQEGVISAVDNDWAFVVVDKGRNQGVRADSTLVVKRGQNFVANLRITDIEADRTVADIDRNSMARGARVMPGDRVVLKTPNR